eukprot:3160820-Rhodomonas_salina.2
MEEAQVQHGFEGGERSAKCGSDVGNGGESGLRALRARGGGEQAEEETRRKPNRQPVLAATRRGGGGRQQVSDTHPAGSAPLVAPRVCRPLLEMTHFSRFQIVPLEAVLAGSRRFRALCESLQIDTNLCKILLGLSDQESSLSTILSEDECRRLVVVDTLDVKEGVLSLCEDGHDSEVWYVLLDGVLDVRDIEHVRRREATEPPPRVQARSFNAGTPFGVRVSRCSRCQRAANTTAS